MCSVQREGEARGESEVAGKSTDALVAAARRRRVTDSADRFQGTSLVDLDLSLAADQALGARVSADTELRASRSACGIVQGLCRSALLLSSRADWFTEGIRDRKV